MSMSRLFVLFVLVASSVSGQIPVNDGFSQKIRSAEETTRIYGYGQFSPAPAISSPVSPRTTPVVFSVDAQSVVTKPIDEVSHQQVLAYHQAGLQTESVRHRMSLDDRQMALRENQTYHRMSLDDRRQTVREREQARRASESFHWTAQTWFRTLGFDERSRRDRQRDEQRAEEAQRRHQERILDDVRGILRDARHDRQERERRSN